MVMLAQQRRQAIVAELGRSGGVRVADLTARFAVSDMTIRRDLEQLESQGRLRRVHGGAVKIGSSVDEPGFEAKRLIAPAAKQAIAARARSLISPRSAVGISAGTTTWMLAQELRGFSGALSVVTNSTTVSEILAPTHWAPQGSAGSGAAADDHDGDESADGPAGDGAVSVILTGGLRTPSAALVGVIADRTIEALHVDQLFLGVHGMDVDAGFTTPNLAEAHTNAIFMSRAKQVVVLADSTKWNTIGLARIAPLGAADVLVTDDGLSGEARAILADTVGELIVVSP